MKHINLEQFAGGKLSVQLNKALEKVTENIQDPNTDAQKVRKINVSISFRRILQRLIFQKSGMLSLSCFVLSLP